MKVLKPYMMLIFVIIIFFTFFFVRRFEHLFVIDHPYSMNEGWIYDGEDLELPIDLNITKNTSYTIESVLNEDFHEPKYIMIRTSLQDITVKLDNVVIYQKEYGTSLLEPYASMWHFVLMPRHVDGQTLSITFSSPYTLMSSQINEIFYGSEVMH